jgi:hypothetical protein
VIAHDGSNRGFYAYVGVVPERRAAIVVMTNVGDPAAKDRVGEIVTYLAKHFLGCDRERPDTSGPLTPVTAELLCALPGL